MIYCIKCFHCINEYSVSNFVVIKRSIYIVKKK